MHIIWLIVGIIIWCMFLFYLTGLALFLLGVGMFLETGNWLWAIPAIVGAWLMAKSN